MTNATYAPFIQRCYSCGRESPAGPLLHYPGCEVGTGTGARLDAVGVGNGCKVTIKTLATPAGSASGEDDALDYQMAASAEAAEVDRRGKRIAALQAEVARLREDAARFGVVIRSPDFQWAGRRWPMLDHDELRAAIDAAIQGSANGQG